MAGFAFRVRPGHGNRSELSPSPPCGARLGCNRLPRLQAAEDQAATPSKLETHGRPSNNGRGTRSYVGGHAANRWPEARTFVAAFAPGTMADRSPAQSDGAPFLGPNGQATRRGHRWANPQIAYSLGTRKRDRRTTNSVNARRRAIPSPVSTKKRDADGYSARCQSEAEPSIPLLSRRSFRRLGRPPASRWRPERRRIKKQANQSRRSSLPHPTISVDPSEPGGPQG